MNAFWWIPVLDIFIFLIGIPTTISLELDTFACEKFKPPILTQPVETCFDFNGTSTAYSNEERQWILFHLNLFRGQIANQCDNLQIKSGSVANYRKLTWSCEVEEKLKFECPEKEANLPRDSKILLTTRFNERGNFFPPTPIFRLSTFNSNLNSKLEFDNLIFNEEATEIGCYRQVCHIENFYLQIHRCSNGFELNNEGLPYTPGERCQQDSDCTIAPHLKCDKSFGLCEIFILYCQTLIPLTTVSFCNTFETHSSYVAIGLKKNFEQYELKGVATIVGKRHLLTSISHFAQKLYNNELYVLWRGAFFPIRSAKFKPNFYVSHYNTSDWVDPLLITLDENSDFSFDDDFIVKISTEKTGTLMDLNGDDLRMDETTFESAEYCEKAFKTDFIQYDQNKMYCANDREENADEFLNGSPIFVKTETDVTLMGIRSVNSVDPRHKEVFMVQKLDKHCDWLAKASYGEVKCTME